MTPQDIAMNINSLSATGEGINASTNFTQSVGMGGYSMDDSNTWD